MNAQDLPWVVFRRWETGHPQTGRKYETMSRFRFRAHAEIYLRGLKLIQDDAHLLYELAYDTPTEALNSPSPHKRNRSK